MLDFKSEEKMLRKQKMYVDKSALCCSFLTVLFNKAKKGIVKIQVKAVQA